MVARMGDAACAHTAWAHTPPVFIVEVSFGAGAASIANRDRKSLRHQQAERIGHN